MRAKVCENIEKCKGLALVKTYLDALVICRDCTTYAIEKSRNRIGIVTNPQQ